MILAALALLAATAHPPANHPQVALSRSRHSPAVHRSHAAPRLRARPAQSGSPLTMYEIGITGSTTEYDGMAHTYAIDGHVKIVLPNMTVTCNQAVISESTDEDRVDQILFLGHVVAVRDRNTFRGDRVTYFVATRRLLAQGDTATRIFMSQNASGQHAPETDKQGSPP